MSAELGDGKRGRLSSGGDSAFAVTSLGLRLISLKSELLSFCLHNGHVRCACHHWLMHSLQYFTVSRDWYGAKCNLPYAHRL